MAEDREAATNYEEEYGVKAEFYEKFPVKVATKASTDKQCAICIKYYNVGCKVFFLPCQHHFHIECIMTWFKTNHVCPNCRYDLNQGQDGDDQEEEEKYDS